MTSTIKVDRIENGAAGTKITLGGELVIEGNATMFGPALKTSSNSVSSNLTIDSGTNGLLIGPISVDSGVAITVNGALTVIQMASILKFNQAQHTNSTDAMSIDTGGRVQMPANPKFSIYLSTITASTNFTAAAGVDIPFDTIDFNVGSCIAISGSDVATFTASVTGYYQFNLLVGTDSMESAPWVSTYLVIDGAATGNITYRNIEDPESGSYLTLSSPAFIYLTAGQTVNPKLNVSTDTSGRIRHGTRFSGFLVPQDKI